MNKQPLFPLGSVQATNGVRARVKQVTMNAALERHEAGDWGSICDEDREENRLSLEHGFRLLSAYEYPDEPKFWIITEADRSVTTFLLPEEY